MPVRQPPNARQRRQDPVPLTLVPGGSPQRPPKVVIVEPYAPLRQVLNELFCESGMVVQGATGSGETALSLIKDNRPTVVVTEIKLNDDDRRFDGYTLVETLRVSEDLDTAVIVYTAAFGTAVDSDDALFQIAVKGDVKPSRLVDLVRAAHAAVTDPTTGRTGT